MPNPRYIKYTNSTIFLPSEATHIDPFLTIDVLVGSIRAMRANPSPAFSDGPSNSILHNKYS